MISEDHVWCHIVRLQNLEDRERKHTIHKEQLSREHRFLRRRLEQLTNQTGLHGLHALHGLHGLSTSAPTGSVAAAASAAMLSKRRSISECSLGTASTSSTGSSSNSDRSAGSPSISESGEYSNEIIIKYVKLKVLFFRWNVFISPRSLSFCLTLPVVSSTSPGCKNIGFVFY